MDTRGVTKQTHVTLDISDTMMTGSRCSQRTQTCRDVSAPMVELGVTSPLVSVDRITPFFRFGPGITSTHSHSHSKQLILPILHILLLHHTLTLKTTHSTHTTHTTTCDWSYSCSVRPAPAKLNF